MEQLLWNEYTLSRLMDKIILVVFGLDIKFVVLNWLLDPYYIFVEENTKLRKQASWTKILRTGCWALLLRCVPGHKAFLLNPSRGTGFSYWGHPWTQGFLTISCHRFCPVQGCSVVNYNIIQKTTNAVSEGEYQKMVNIEKKTWKQNIWFSEVIKELCHLNLQEK